MIFIEQKKSLLGKHELILRFTQSKHIPGTWEQIIPLVKNLSSTHIKETLVHGLLAMTLLQQKLQSLNARLASITLTGSCLQGPDSRTFFQSSSRNFYACRDREGKRPMLVALKYCLVQARILKVKL